MKKTTKKMIAIVSCGLMLVAGAGFALAQSPVISAGKGQVQETGGPGAAGQEMNDGQEINGGQEMDGQTAATVDGQAQETAGNGSQTIPGGVQVGTVDENGEPHLSTGQIMTGPGPAMMPETSQGSEAQDGASQNGAQAGAEVSDPALVWGPVESVAENEIVFDNQSGHSVAGTIVLHFDPQVVPVVDGVNGLPVNVADIQVGEVIYVYLGPAMTMSLPPQNNPEMVICQIPADARAPQFVKVQAMTQQADGSYVLTSEAGATFTVPADCPIQPYLTRNIVTLADVNEASQCLVWADEAGAAQKMVLFPAE